MNIRSKLLLTGFMLVLPSENVFAWQTGQHKSITQAAADKAAPDCPDIKNFEGTIINWSGGIGGAAQNSGVFKASFASIFGGKPAEELAHTENQTKNILDTGMIDEVGISRPHFG